MVQKFGVSKIFLFLFFRRKKNVFTKNALHQPQVTIKTFLIVLKMIFQINYIIFYFKLIKDCKMQTWWQFFSKKHTKLYWPQMFERLNK